jgi:tetratricopeptide (TPR) repeat protein
VNKWLAIALSLSLSACVTTPDLRPELYLKSEQMMQQGLQAYEQDNFTEAQQKFSQALELYQSFDNDKGIALSLLNLIETALGVSDFKQAQVYLKQVKSYALATDLKRKVILLEVKLAFEQENYPLALANLKPLLGELEGQKNLGDAQLNLLAMQARLEVLNSSLTQSAALAKFETALAQNEAKSPYYQALLQRILAVIALKRRDYLSATTLLTQALTYYKEQANRRSIAACLEDLAEIEIAQRHQPAAQNYLQRALVIRQWLKNKYKSDKIVKQLQLITDVTRR